MQEIHGAPGIGACLEDGALVARSTRQLPTEWVLRRLYGFDRERVAAALRGLIALDNLRVEDPQTARLALDWTDQGLDFTDALHLTSSLAAGRFATFDTKLKNRAERFQGVYVVGP